MKAAAFALSGLLAQAIPPAGLWLLAQACYGGTRWLPQAAEEGVSLAWLAISTAIAWGMAGRASYRLLTEHRPLGALPLVAICCIPGWLAGAFYFQAILVFTGLI